MAVTTIRFDENTRAIIDGRTTGFCKLIVDHPTCTVLGCHVVGERAVKIVQAAAIAMAARMRVDDLARVPLSLPTYAAILGRAAYRAAEQLNLDVSGQLYPGGMKQPPITVEAIAGPRNRECAVFRKPAHDLAVDHAPVPRTGTLGYSMVGHYIPVRTLALDENSCDPARRTTPRLGCLATRCAGIRGSS